MPDPRPRKTVRSYRLVFRRRWRIFQIQGWRIPLPGGLELRLLGYWLACLSTVLALAALPLLGRLATLVPPSLRLLALPLAAAWGLSRWELDGRPPHRALLGLLRFSLRPRQLAALRRCPPPRARLAPLGELALGPDFAGPRVPPGRLPGPARLLLRYPTTAEPRPRPLARTPTWRLRPCRSAPLRAGKTLSVPAGAALDFGPPPR